MNEREDFVARCKSLQLRLEVLALLEESPRVWISVMGILIRSIILHQKDPIGAFNQLKTLMDPTLEEKQESQAEESVKDSQ